MIQSVNIQWFCMHWLLRRKLVHDLSVRDETGSLGNRVNNYDRDGSGQVSV